MLRVERGSKTQRRSREKERERERWEERGGGSVHSRLYALRLTVLARQCVSQPAGASVCIGASLSVRMCV